MPDALAYERRSLDKKAEGDINFCNSLGLGKKVYSLNIFFSSANSWISRTTICWTKDTDSVAACEWSSHSRWFICLTSVGWCASAKHRVAHIGTRPGSTKYGSGIRFECHSMDLLDGVWARSWWQDWGSPPRNQGVCFRWLPFPFPSSLSLCLTPAIFSAYLATRITWTVILDVAAIWSATTVYAIHSSWTISWRLTVVNTSTERGSY